MIKEAYETAQNAEGSALRENEAWMQSIEGRVEKLTNQIQEFWHTAINTDVVKSMIDLLTTAVELATELVDKIGLIPTLITPIVTALSIKNGGGRAKICCIKKVNYPPRV